MGDWQFVKGGGTTTRKMCLLYKGLPSVTYAELIFSKFVRQMFLIHDSLVGPGQNSSKNQAWKIEKCLFCLFSSSSVPFCDRSENTAVGLNEMWPKYKLIMGV